MASADPLNIGKRLAEAGIPPHTRRVIVDIPCDGMVKVYYECLCDQSVLDVVLDVVKDAKIVPADDDDGA